MLPFHTNHFLQQGHCCLYPAPPASRLYAVLHHTALSIDSPCVTGLEKESPVLQNVFCICEWLQQGRWKGEEFVTWIRWRNFRFQILWEHSHAYLCIWVICVHLCATLAELTGWKKDPPSHKVWNKMVPCSSQKVFATPRCQSAKAPVRIPAG